jgi:flagellar biogenesis protein FliO
MKDPRNFLCRPLSAAAVLIAASMCSVAHCQSFYQQAQFAADSKDGSTWQPPSAAARSRPSIRQVTNLVPLKPPSDIFVPKDRPVAKPSTAPPVASTAWNQTGTGPLVGSSTLGAIPPQPKPFSTSGQFVAARRLGNSTSSTSNGNGLFDTINALAESDQPKFAKANMEFGTTSGRSNFEALTSDATAKLGNVKDWLGEKTSALFGGMKDSGWQERISRMFGGADIKRIVGGLAVVIGGYLGLVWLLQMINPAGSGAIPREALEVVGSAPLNSKQNLQLIRLGSKLMLMIHGPDGVQPVGEVSDPAEVEDLLAICGGRGQRVLPAVGAAIENRLRPKQQNPLPERQIAQQQSASVSLSPTDSNSLNQLLRALEKYQQRGHVYEA